VTGLDFLVVAKGQQTADIEFHGRPVGIEKSGSQATG